MAGGSTRSAFNVSFSRDNNIADITAKATSQTICTSLVGTAAGISLCSAIGQDVNLALGAYVTLAGIHLSTAYRYELHPLPRAHVPKGSVLTLHGPLCRSPLCCCRRVRIWAAFCFGLRGNDVFLREAAERGRGGERRGGLGRGKGGEGREREGREGEGREREGENEGQEWGKEGIQTVGPHNS